MNHTYKLFNEAGVEITLSSIGAGIVDIIVPDKSGSKESILVHPLNIKDYETSKCYFGKPTGRTAGRIENGIFNLEGKTYKIKKAKGNKHALHGGVEGFAFKEFKAEEEENEDSKSVTFRYFSKDGEGGYPGNLNVEITYTLSKYKSKLRVEHRGLSDQTTLLNLTNHAYFNLSGNCKRNILDQVLYINSEKVGEVNKDVISTGIKETGEVYDFRTPHKIGDYIEDDECQRNSRGYDNPYIISEPGENSLSAFLLDNKSGRYLKIKSSYDCLVFYSTNFPDEVVVNTGSPLKKYDGCCLEFQHFPNGVNSDFIFEKKDILTKGEKYNEFIEYEFCLN